MKSASLAVLLVAAAVPAFAVQPLTVDEEGMEEMLRGRSGEALEQMASGECPAERCFDGRPVLRAEGPLVILKEEKLREERGRWRGGVKGERHYEPPKVVFKQTVGVADRPRYVSEKKKDGMILGGLGGGLLGALLGFLVNPILGVGVLAAGLVTGYVKGKKSGEEKPRVFEREQAYEKE